MRVSLWCTVSGGLEELALEEVNSVFAAQLAAEPAWRVQGNSGSQMAWLVDCSVGAGMEELARQILRLRAVEYVSIEINTATVPVETAGRGSDLLATLERQIADTTNRARFKTALEVWGRCSDGLQQGSRLQLGTEGLPGVLLPTPELMPGSFAAEARVPGIGFNVNTIFTADAVAKVVVDCFVALVEQDQECSPRATMAGHYLWLDAGAGGGALLRHLPAGRRLGLDTSPAAEGIVQADFLSPECSLDWVRRQHQRLQDAQTEDDVPICVISNPPFSEGSRGNFSAIAKFINKAVLDLEAGVQFVSLAPSLLPPLLSLTTRTHARARMRARTHTYTHTVSGFDAAYVGVIVPEGFTRRRVWQAMGLTELVELRARFVLPRDAFVVPASGETKHINSYFLFFRTQTESTTTRDAQQVLPPTSSAAGDVTPNDNQLPINLHVVGKRGPRGAFEFSTADFTASVVRGLQDVQACGFALCRSDGPLQTMSRGQTLSQLATLNAVLTRHSEVQRKPKKQQRQPQNPEKLVDSNRGRKSQSDQVTLELSLQLNAKLPLSLVNCVSATLSGEETHALGWVASSLKPVVAFAMCRLARDACATAATRRASVAETHTESGTERHRETHKDTQRVSAPAVCLDLMCGEGTITLEGGGNGFFVTLPAKKISLMTADPLWLGIIQYFGCRSRFLFPGAGSWGF